jgi:uncharacterized membrane protein
MRPHLYVASVLVAVLLLAGTAKAETAPSKAPSQPAASAEQQKPAKSGKPHLSDEKSSILKTAMSKARADNKQLNEQIKAKRKDLAALMKAEKFDKAAFLAKNVEVQELISKAARARTEAMATVAEKFSVQDRKILAERFEKRKEGRGGHDEGKKANEKSLKE